jgi:hypothetical protein
MIRTIRTSGILVAVISATLMLQGCLVGAWWVPASMP